MRILHGQAETIRIENPGITKAEFVIGGAGHRELHQAKRSHPNGKWSLASLGAKREQLLQSIFHSLSGNDDRFIFVSASDAVELRELSERARQAESAEEFVASFLDASARRVSFQTLSSEWGNSEEATAFDVLRRIEVRTIDERSLEEQVEWGLKSLFLSKPGAICDRLRCLVEDSVHKTITRQDLVDFLRQQGFTLRRLAKPEDALSLVEDVTLRYLAGARKRLIRDSLIHRSETQVLIARIEDGESEVVLTGKAGSGKTGCVIDLTESLRARNVPVLAFRLDRVKPVRTTAELGVELGIEESPVLVLKAASANLRPVLIVDQLDAVSTTSGRSVDFIEVVEDLLMEARGVAEAQRLHVIVVCRAFDWENDHRLRHLLSQDHAKIEVGEFTLDEAKDVLRGAGFRVDEFQDLQLEMLRLPQNLSLFVEAGSDPAKTPAFKTAKELLDRYWDKKRRAVADRTEPSPDLWADVIRLLCDEMNRTQQLSVPREKLDGFSPDYIGQMASEGVLTFDGQRYGFGHETFFDYCFARTFAAQSQSLVEFVKDSEQHLFRRAQVRQVLTYLRDGDRPRYCAELEALLTDKGIRLHIKDLAIALTVDVPHPGQDEWKVLEPFLNSELTAFEQGQRNPDRLASLVWQHFFGSHSWFHLADEKGLVAGWLASDIEAVTNMAIHYLRVHQRHAGDRVTELLEPYVGRGGDWPERLRHMVEWAGLDESRPFFDLVLLLIDDGTLDEARTPVAVNGTFWHMFYQVGEKRPEWLPEVIAHWLRRRLALAQMNGVPNDEYEWEKRFNEHGPGTKDFRLAASAAPEAFVAHVLPAVLEVSDAATRFKKERLPRRDAVWTTLIKSEHGSVSDDCLEALVIALRGLAEKDPVRLEPVIDVLRGRETYTANLLLLSICTGGAAHFADRAAELLAEQSWRFDCGYVDSPRWISMQLLGAISPLCLPVNVAKLEAAILDYSPPYERTAMGRRSAGRASLELLSAIPAGKRTRSTQERFLELERKFGKPNVEPRGIKVERVGPPIESQAAEKMTDDQWLSAVVKYSAEESGLTSDGRIKGGAWELAGVLQEHVRTDPVRFARLSLRFPADTNPAYIERTLEGLKETAAPAELKLAICQKAFDESPVTGDN